MKRKIEGSGWVSACALFCAGAVFLMKQYKSPSRAGETNRCWKR